MHGGYANFYSRPCGRGDEADVCGRNAVIISTHAPAGGATYKVSTRVLTVRCISTHAPAGGATWMIRSYKGGGLIFLLTPLREGRLYRWYRKNGCGEISTHAPAGGATRGEAGKKADWTISTHAPAGGATVMARWAAQPPKFLLTPLREGRRRGGTGMNGFLKISTHAPAGGATGAAPFLFSLLMQFLLTPLREGRRAAHPHRGPRRKISTHAPAGGATDDLQSRITTMNRISTHAPAGGATAIFHKSVMRFCGKLPKDDTVLCLASFGFPRRDPKAVYLAWISCANLPQKCVRQGLALKDQGTSCFHEGLASHAFDPVLV